MKTFFITSSGTGIGKTLITAALCHQLKIAGHKVKAIKPVACGVDEHAMQESDTGLLLQSMGLPLTEENINGVSPFRYQAPLSPDMAARQEGRPLDFEKLLQFCTQQQAGNDDYLFIEGVGGVMVPLDGQHTVLDWIISLQVPVLLVVGSYLGTLSHTLTSYHALRSKNIDVRAVLVSESENSTVPWDETLHSLKAFTGKTPVHGVRRYATVPLLWKHLPDLTRIIT